MEKKKASDLYDQLVTNLDEAKPVLTDEFRVYLISSCQKAIELNYTAGKNGWKFDNTITDAVQKVLDASFIFSDSFKSKVIWGCIHSASTIAFYEGEAFRKPETICHLLGSLPADAAEYVKTLLDKMGEVNKYYDNHMKEDRGEIASLKLAVQDYNHTHALQWPTILDEVVNFYHLI